MIPQLPSKGVDLLHLQGVVSAHHCLHGALQL